MSPAVLRTTATALALVGVVSQLLVALMADAIGGPSAVVFILAADAILALAGAALVWRWMAPGLTLIGVAGLAALVVMFWSTLLEIGVAAFLFGAMTAAGLSLRAPARAGTQG